MKLIIIDNNITSLFSDRTIRCINIQNNSDTRIIADNVTLFVPFMDYHDIIADYNKGYLYISNNRIMLCCNISSEYDLTSELMTEMSKNNHSLEDISNVFIDTYPLGIQIFLRTDSIMYIFDFFGLDDIKVSFNCIDEKDNYIHKDMKYFISRSVKKELTIKSICFNTEKIYDTVKYVSRIKHDIIQIVHFRNYFVFLTSNGNIYYGMCVLGSTDYICQLKLNGVSTSTVKSIHVMGVFKIAVLFHDNIIRTLIIKQEEIKLSRAFQFDFNIDSLFTSEIFNDEVFVVESNNKYYSVIIQDDDTYCNKLDIYENISSILVSGSSNIFFLDSNDEEKKYSMKNIVSDNIKIFYIITDFGKIYDGYANKPIEYFDTNRLFINNPVNVKSARLLV